jgi:hypothetical protein
VRLRLITHQARVLGTYEIRPSCANTVEQFQFSTPATRQLRCLHHGGERYCFRIFDGNENSRNIVHELIRYALGPIRPKGKSTRC